MTTPKRQRVQIDMSDAVKRRAKAVAAERGIPFVDLVLQGLSEVGDKRLATLIEQERANKAKPGRPES